MRKFTNNGDLYTYLSYIFMQHYVGMVYGEHAWHIYMSCVLFTTIVLCQGLAWSLLDVALLGHSNVEPQHCEDLSGLGSVCIVVPVPVPKTLQQKKSL